MAGLIAGGGCLVDWQQVLLGLMVPARYELAEKHEEKSEEGVGSILQWLKMPATMLGLLLLHGCLLKYYLREAR